MQACKKEETPRAASVDDGWSIPSEPARSLIHAVPSPEASTLETSGFQACDFDACVAGATELDGGWSLAEGTFEHEVSEFASSRAVMPLSFRPAPLAPDQVLSAEAQEEFSKPDLALGTDVEVPPPAGLWFADLATVVERKVPRSARQTTPMIQEVNIKSCLSASEDSLEDSFFAGGDAIDGSSETEAHAGEEDEDEADEPKRRWWHWRR